jgi:Protein of unknown function (DUF2865)
MRRQANKRLQWGAAALCGIAILIAIPGLTQTAKAQGFFWPFFNTFGGGQPPAVQTPFANGSESIPYVRRGRPRVRSSSSGQASNSGQAYCVRTCDGRYFPITGSDQDSRVTNCNSFCPTSETKIVYGGDIDSATTESGKPYSELPNAFRYRKEVVAGCTCNGKDQFGLARVEVNNDPTLRKGDIVASAGGLMAVKRAPDKRGALNFSRVPASVSAKYRHLPVVARE